jgi:putative intracellular protease/amidase
MKKVRLVIALLALIGAFGSLSSAQSQTATEKPKMNVAILIFDGVQIIDYTGPYEVLGGWNKRHVYTVAEKADAITTNMGMRVIPNYTFENQPRADIMIIPGGRGVAAQLENQKAIKWIQESSSQAKYVMSVCNGAYLLAKAGLLDGLEATTTAGLIEGLKTLAPKTKMVYDRRVVDNGKIMTTAGLSAGIDGALHLIEKMDGKGWAQQVALGIEYNWQPDSGWTRAALADMKLPSSIYEPFYTPEANLLGVTEGVDAWEEKWSVPSSSSPSEMLQRINEKWATEAKWSRADTGKSNDAASTTTSSWKFTDEKGQPWSGTVSVKPLAAEKNRLLVTLNITRGDTNVRAQVK